MLKLLRTTALACAVAASSFVAAPERAQAQSYQIDCAILLCLSGGWPASEPCARARAEFIRRITPWPVEPPLQIWRCPMGASFNVDPSELNRTRIFDILMQDSAPAPLQSLPSAPLTDDALEPQPAVLRQSGGTARRLPEGFALHFVQEGEYSDDNGTADIDISGSEFDFVRSIRVFNVTYARQRESGVTVIATAPRASVWGLTAPKAISIGGVLLLVRCPRHIPGWNAMANTARASGTVPSLWSGATIRAIMASSRSTTKRSAG